MLTFGAQYGSSVQFQKMNGNKNFLFLWGFPRNMKLECFPSITYFPLKEVSFLDSARNFLFLNDLFCNCLHSISWQQRLTKAFHNINCVFYCKVKTFLFKRKTLQELPLLLSWIGVLNCLKYLHVQKRDYK